MRGSELQRGRWRAAGEQLPWPRRTPTEASWLGGFSCCVSGMRRSKTRGVVLVIVRDYLCLPAHGVEGHGKMARSPSRGWLVVSNGAGRGVGTVTTKRHDGSHLAWVCNVAVSFHNAM